MIGGDHLPYSRERSFFSLTRALLPSRPELLGEQAPLDGRIVISARHREQNHVEAYVLLVMVFAFWAGLTADIFGGAVWLLLTVPLAPLAIHIMQLAVGLGCGGLQRLELLETRGRRPVHSVIHVSMVVVIAFGWTVGGGGGWFSWIAWPWMVIGALNALASGGFAFRMLFEDGAHDPAVRANSNGESVEDAS